MAALATVQNYIDEARILLQDVSGTRYSDTDIVGALNLAFLEARRLRPDFYIKTPSTIPSYSTGSLGTSVDVDVQYRHAFLYFIVVTMNLRVGSVLPVLNTAIGRLFLAYLAPAQTARAPRKNTLMLDFSPSEFSRFRLQFAQDRARMGVIDNQWFLQYQVSLGAHGAHKF